MERVFNSANVSGRSLNHLVSHTEKPHQEVMHLIIGQLVSSSFAYFDEISS